MLYRVEREPSHVLCRIIPELIGHEAVAELMQRYAYKCRNDCQKHIGQYRPVKVAYHIGKGTCIKHTSVSPPSAHPCRSPSQRKRE